MKKLLKVFAAIVIVIIVGIVGVVIFIKAKLPDVGPAPVVKIDYTQERIARGRYMANSVTVCMDCHSTRDWSQFAGPLVPGTLGKGGERFDQKFGFPGMYISKNITPAGISRYTDGELYRVITTGVNKEGQAMFPVMPYTHYGKMDSDDVVSIIAYIRSIDPIENHVEASVSDFPMNIIINTIPQKANPQRRPDTSMHVQYGAYLVNAAGCVECHTKDNHGQIIQELAFRGGREFKLPDIGTIRSSNITPDPETGIGNWTAEAFVNKFKAYADSNYKSPKLGKGDFNTIMPWTMYARMNKADLLAIYEYLRTLPAAKNEVVKFTKI